MPQNEKTPVAITWEMREADLKDLAKLLIMLKHGACTRSPGMDRTPTRCRVAGGASCTRPSGLGAAPPSGGQLAGTNKQWQLRTAVETDSRQV